MCVITIVFAVAYTLAVAVDLIMKKILSVNGQLVYIILGVLLLLSVLIAAGLQLICWFQGVSAHVTKYQGVKCFEEIDSYIKNLGEGNNYYCSVIYEINETYKINPELKKLSRENNLEVLYTRKAYLENNLESYSNMVQVVTAFGISALVALAQPEIIVGGWRAFGFLILMVIGLLLCLTLKYVEKGRGDSYIYNLYEYELKLLNKKIQSINKRLQVNEDTKRILQLRHVAINALVNLYSDRKALKKLGQNKKYIEEKYKELSDAPLLQDLEGTDIIWAKKDIGESPVYFPMKIKGGKYQFLNENYKRIYDILQKNYIL